ncbi:MAG: hypothetical protein M1816_004837 [Peltula sp. TS41687]|nr:MAG: hypothetical protein M1816_004837 [Peltula sp. TS41687]
MPPKRHPIRPSTKPPTRKSSKKNEISRIAQDNDLTADQESEIREAYRLFARPFPTDAEEDTTMHDDTFAEEGILATSDVRRALIALDLTPSTSSSGGGGELREILATLDPTGTGFTTYGPFASVCALKMQSQMPTSTAGQGAEVEAAFKLFTRGGQGPITVSHLRRIARELKEEERVSDEQLRDMILEANGGRGVARGVGKEEFEAVMSRAGVFTP